MALSAIMQYDKDDYIDKYYKNLDLQVE